MLLFVLHYTIALVSKHRVEAQNIFSDIFLYYINLCSSGPSDRKTLPLTIQQHFHPEQFIIRPWR